MMIGMISSRLFWKLFLGFTAINLLTTATLLITTWRWQEESSYALVERELKTTASLVAKLAEDWLPDDSELDKEELAEQLSEISDQANIEISVLNVEGETVSSTPTFLIGSSTDVLIQLAIERGDATHWADPNYTNEKSRDSQPEDATYGEIPNENSEASSTVEALPHNAYALRVLDEKNQLLGVVVTSQLDGSVRNSLSSLWQLYAIWGFIASLLVIGIGYGVVTHLVGPISVLNAAANAMAKGDYSQRAFVPNNDELGTLASAFNRMSEALDSQLSALQESDRRQATVLRGMMESVVAVDESQSILFANSAAGKLFDFLPPNVVGRPLLEVIRHHTLQEASQAVIRSHQRQRLEIDWDEKNLSVQVTPLVGEPSAGAVIVLHDVTELKRLESLRRDFVANVSHELKTPLSSIKAYTETLQNGASEDAENCPKFLSRIAEQAERLDDLIRDMLSLARIESAQQPFDMRQVDLVKLVLTCVEEHKQRAEARKIELCSIPTDAANSELFVTADFEGLRVILNNLLDNAIKYTTEGGKVNVQWAKEENWVRLDISDTGIGIAEEKLGRVFERFYRVDAARNREQGGTGLGLSIVKHLTQAFGGEVSVNSVEGEGTTFSVSLPSV